MSSFFEALNAQVPLEGYLVVAAVMFAIGAWGALIRRNAVVLFMCVELMINAVNLTLVAFSDFLPGAGGLGANYAVLVIAIAAAEVAVGLAIVLAVFRTRRTVNIDEVNTMRG
ncbi:NADH:ubiquinone oxidoreductase subunit 11 or 4L (chain K) [Rubrobacter radiotolerans]|uniref:NADH-quinone oxidoreductase subunit K n=1 Tax=Rubrobacter radiotolerans TaxID=42256 RepID=A0A023X3S5_RUBRA|nr:NADH-quinone oxidoreductase subunit NuoK [Rubrobacter radiotolerans]AHY46851.1 NADH:ubiquinone oxidoreductase subunit 11 or 4L (chain K) [Rubrobacter radiotolerans]MDX5894257.1 NADH-quinone oxidoreductase subunit NuoK [Rubrobacter radiotolerans]SMC05579.1 NADH dehydrogenase subunit K [Rubrobacter radiotolerans DSM 5868]